MKALELLAEEPDGEAWFEVKDGLKVLTEGGLKMEQKTSAPGGIFCAY